MSTIHVPIRRPPQDAYLRDAKLSFEATCGCHWCRATRATQLWFQPPGMGGVLFEPSLSKRIHDLQYFQDLLQKRSSAPPGGTIHLTWEEWF